MWDRQMWDRGLWTALARSGGAKLRYSPHATSSIVLGYSLPKNNMMDSIPR